MSTETRLLRLPAVLARCALSRSTVYRLVSEKRFPAPVKILGSSHEARASAWIESEVETWLQARIAEARVVR